MEESNPDLDSFRRQWREEVSARRDDRNLGQAASSKASKASRRQPRPSQHLPAHESHESNDEEHSEPAPEAHRVFEAEDDGQDAVNASRKKAAGREPRSALEHYEKAVEREAQGSLGDSLDLYRKAFRVSFLSIDTCRTQKSPANCWL